MDNKICMQSSELSCDLCGNMFNSFSQLKSHKKLHGSQQGLKCGICNRIYLSKKLFVKHLQSHEKPVFFSCSECNKTFPNKTRLRTHSRSHTGERPFKCPQCNSYFASKYQVKLHERRHTGEKPHCCPVCKKRFSASSGLGQHMKIHTTEAPFSCSVCNKSFKQKEKLENHSRIHTGVKPYMCDRCPLVFRLKHVLVRHLRIHLGETYKCSLCPKKFGELYALKKHHRNKHTGIDFSGPATTENTKEFDANEGPENLLKNDTTKTKAKQERDSLKRTRKKIKAASSHISKFVSDKCFLMIRDRDSSTMVEENGWHRIPLPGPNRSNSTIVMDKISNLCNEENCQNKVIQHQRGHQSSQQLETKESCPGQERENLKINSCDHQTCIFKYKGTEDILKVTTAKPAQVNHNMSQTCTIEDEGEVGDCHIKSDKSYKTVDISSNPASNAQYMQLNQIAFEKEVIRNKIQEIDYFTPGSYNLVTHHAQMIHSQHYDIENYHSKQVGHLSMLCNIEAKHDRQSSNHHHKLGLNSQQQQLTICHISDSQSDHHYIDGPLRNLYDSYTAAPSRQASKGCPILFHLVPDNRASSLGENRKIPNLLISPDQSDLAIYYQHTRHMPGRTGSQERCDKLVVPSGEINNQKPVADFSLYQERFEGPQEISFHGGSNVVHHMPEPSLLEGNNEEDTGPIKWSTCQYDSQSLPNSKHQDVYSAQKSKCAVLSGNLGQTALQVDTENLKTHSDTPGKTQYSSDTDCLKKMPHINCITYGSRTTPDASLVGGLEKIPYPNVKDVAGKTPYPIVTVESGKIPNLCVTGYVSRISHSNASKCLDEESAVVPTPFKFVDNTNPSNTSSLHSNPCPKTEPNTAIFNGNVSTVSANDLSCQFKEADQITVTCHPNLKNNTLMELCLGMNTNGNSKSGNSPTREDHFENYDNLVQEISQHRTGTNADSPLTLETQKSLIPLSESSLKYISKVYRRDGHTTYVGVGACPMALHDCNVIKQESCGRITVGQRLKDVADPGGAVNNEQVMKHENIPVNVQQDLSLRFGRPLQLGSILCKTRSLKKASVGKYAETKVKEDDVFYKEVSDLSLGKQCHQPEGDVGVEIKRLIDITVDRNTGTNAGTHFKMKKSKHDNTGNKVCHEKIEEVQADKANVEHSEADKAGQQHVKKTAGQETECRETAAGEKTVRETAGRETSNTSNIEIKTTESEQTFHPDVSKSIQICPESQNNELLLGDQSQVSCKLLAKGNESEQNKNAVRAEFVKANCIIDEDLGIRRCRICGNEYKNIGCLRKHIFTCHFNGLRHQCKICEKNFPHKSRLDRHLKTHVGQKPFPCSLCQQEFTAQKHLDNHIKRHSKVPPIFMCDECGKTFPRKYQLKVHKRIHSGEKPYKCTYCRNCFATSFQAHLHERVHTGERPYQCRYCGKCFRGSANLSSHVKCHTNDRPHLCATCGASFHEASKLKAHIRIHTGARPFMCDQCPKVFKVKHLLVKHMRWHSGDVFKCNFCDKIFDEKWVLRKHTTKHQNKNSS